MITEAIVKIPTGGLLRGSVKKALNGKPFYSFEGIPFAEPPIGPLRFKAPLPVAPWEGIRNALSKGPPNFCAYHVIPRDTKIKRGIAGSEDCLYLNVFTPSLPKENGGILKAVLVFIHGGGFNSGETHKYGAEVLVSEDVVLVTVAYRLGALGFLAFDDPKLGVTGNAGLKDMVLSLKWVRENIEAFGGDPQNVTISGESAGGSSVHYLILSQSAKGLFHKAIMQSGTSLCYWAKGNPNNGLTMAEKFNIKGAKNDEILDYLQKVPVDEIIKAQLQITHHLLPSIRRQFCPVIENRDSENAFIIEDPIKIILSGKYSQVPMIFGYNKDEGAIFTLSAEFARKVIGPDNAMPYWLNLKKGDKEFNEVYQKILNYYLDGGSLETMDQEMMFRTVKKFAGDIAFVRPIIQAVKLHSIHHDQIIYMYKLSVVTKLAYVTRGRTGDVCHADILGYQFLLPNTPEVAEGSLEDISRKRIVQFFTNFAKTGNPNSAVSNEIQWTPLKRNEFKLLNIGEQLTMEDFAEDENMKFWDDLYSSFEGLENY